MKKFLITLILFISMMSSAFADDYQKQLLRGIQAYKEGDYLGTVQVMEKIIENNPGSMLAHYYLAISYVQIGKPDEAKIEYDRVIFLDPNSQLAGYAELGKERLNPEKEKEKNESVNKFLQDAEINIFSENVEEGLKQRKLRYIIDNANKRREITPDEFKKFKDFTPKSSVPTREEIAQAYQTLSRAGLNPRQNYGFNPEMMQMSMLGASLGGNTGGPANSGNSMNMLPFLMMMQNRQDKIDPEFMQSMISNMMMPDMMNLYDSKNNY